MTDAPPATDADSPARGERIAKRLARAGICSRRDAERLIAAGRVAVDGRTLTTPAVLVTAASAITVDGQPVGEAPPPRLWRYHKPRGLITTHRDPQGRKTIFDALPADMPRVISVGRLDVESEGLLLLTNDGALARHIELPSTGWARRYRVRVYGKPDPKALADLERGVTIDGMRYGTVRAAIEHQGGANSWIAVTIHEGKNREIRRVMEHLGLSVNRLIRVGFGPFQLGKLEPGEVAEVPRRMLSDQLGGEWARPPATGTAKPRRTTRHANRRR